MIKIDSVPVVYDLDPETGEATGTVHPFCSDECRAAYTPEGSHAFGREDAATNFGFVPKCERCGVYVCADDPDNPDPLFETKQNVGTSQELP